MPLLRPLKRNFSQHRDPSSDIATSKWDDIDSHPGPETRRTSNSSLLYYHLNIEPAELPRGTSFGTKECLRACRPSPQQSHLSAADRPYYLCLSRLSTPDMSPPAISPSSRPSKPQRVLACVRCQHRKVKCDRRFPCANCTTARAQCIPATVTSRGQRKRRFPERELLERLRKYEDLLRQNNINFEPLHKDPAGETESPETRGGQSDEEQPESAGIPSPAATVKSEKVYEAKYVFSKKSVSID